MPKTKNLPLSGSEPKFTNRRWGSNRVYQITTVMPTPWETMKRTGGKNPYQVIGLGLSNVKHDYTTCKDLPKRVISDNPKSSIQG